MLAKKFFEKVIKRNQWNFGNNSKSNDKKST